MSLALKDKDPRIHRNPQANTRGEDRKPPLYVEEVVGPTGRPLRREEIRYGPSLKLDESGRLALDADQLGVVWLSVRTVAAHYTATDADDVVLADATAGTVNVTLPLAAQSEGHVIHIKKVDTVAGNKVVAVGNGSETIDKSASKELDYLAPVFESITVVSDGTEWWIL